MKFRYIPAGAIKVQDKKSDAVAYLYERAGSLYGMVYFGKQTKAAANYRYRTIEQREKNITEFFARRRAAQAYQVQRREARKAWVNDYKVGEIVNTCWGYEQTNREYYEIVAVKGKRVTIRRIAVGSYATGWAQEQVRPLPGEYVGEPKVCYASERGIKTGRHSFTYATRTSFKEAVPGVKVYESGYVSSYA